MLALADYDAVLALSEERHFGRAARRLGVTQPALTARLRRVEGQLDARLFDRGRSGVVPTTAGLAFIEGARRVLDAASETADAVRGAQAGFGETLRLGMTQIAAHQIVVPVLARFRESQPAARLRLTEGTTAGLEAALERRELDAAFVHPPLHASDLSERVLHTTPFRRFSIEPGDERPLVRYPRPEAPVLMGVLARRDAASAEAVGTLAEADTVLGAITLAEAGYGTFAAPDDYPHPSIRRHRGAEPAETVLETSLAWRSLDRRPIIRLLLAAARHAKLENGT